MLWDVPTVPFLTRHPGTQAHERVVGLGNPQLAMLYLVHGSALQQMIKAGAVPEKGRADAARQSVAALQAAYKIQGSCYGPGHPLVRSSQRAAAEAVKSVIGK